MNRLLKIFFLFQTYFEDNPRDLQVLRHDKSLHTVKVQKHLKNVPDYLCMCTVYSHTNKLEDFHSYVILKINMTNSALCFVCLVPLFQSSKEYISHINDPANVKRSAPAIP